MQLAIYKERLYPSFSFSLALILSGPMVLLAALPFGSPLAISLGVIVPIALNVALYLLSPVIDVSDRSLRADRIEVPLSAVGQATALDAEAFGRLLGPEADPRAQLMIRGYIKGGVKVAISDPADPTPYVLLSSRRPEQLAVALQANRT